VIDQHLRIGKAYRAPKLQLSIQYTPKQSPIVPAEIQPPSHLGDNPRDEHPAERSVHGQERWDIHNVFWISVSI
jgi:hypothetical protein